MEPWVWWLVAAGALAVAELLTLDLTLVLLAPAAVAASIAAAAGAGVAVQVICLAVVAALSLLVIRPVVRRHLRTPRALRTGTAALVGATGVALTAVGADGGLVRIRGEAWSARSWDPREEIAEGARVEVVRIEGATAVVRGDLAELP